MARFSGSALVVQWIDASGTVVISGTQKTLDVEDGIDTIDVTGGADQHRTYVSGVKDGTASMTLWDNGTAGTATYARLASGSAGTLVWSPAGTQTGASRYSKPGIVTKNKRGYPFDDGVARDLEWQFTGVYVWDGDNGSTW